MVAGQITGANISSWESWPWFQPLLPCRSPHLPPLAPRVSTFTVFALTLPFLRYDPESSTFSPFLFFFQLFVFALTHSIHRTFSYLRHSLINQSRSFNYLYQTSYLQNPVRKGSANF